MHRRLLLLPLALVSCLLWTGCASLTLPRAGIVEGPPAEALPDVGAVVLEDEATLEYRSMTLADGRRRLVAVLDHRRKLKVLRPEGAAEARVRLPIDGESTVTRVVARSITPDGRVTRMAPDAAWGEAQPGIGKGAPELQVLTFDVPKPQVGGAVEYRYERVYLDPWAVPPWVFGGRLPTLRASFGVISPSSMRIDLLHGRGERAVDRQPAARDRFAGKERLVFREDDLPGYFAEPQGMHVARRSPWLAPQLRAARVDGEPRRLQTWNDVAAHLLPQLDEVGAAAGEAPVAQRLAEIRTELSILPEAPFASRKPQTAEALAQGSLACSRDAAAFALGRLGGARAPTGPGPKVRLALLTGPQAPPLRDEFPAIYPFRRAAVQVQLDASLLQGAACDGPAWHREFICGLRPGEWVLYAPDCPSCQLGMVPLGYAGARALVVDEAGHATWTTLDAGEPSRHGLTTEAHLTMDVAGEVTGKVDAEAHGLPAALWRDALEGPAVRGGDKDKAAEPAAVHARAILGDGQAPAASNLTVRGLGDVERGLWAHGQLATRVEQQAQDRYVLRFATVAGESIPVSWRPSRQEAAVLPGPSWHEATVLLKLPLGTEAQVRAPVRLVHEAAEYAAGYVQHGRTLKLSRRFVLKAAAVRPEAWHSFQDFFARVRAFERAPIVLQPPE